MKGQNLRLGRTYRIDLEGRFYWQRYNISRWWHDTLPNWVAAHLPLRVVYFALIRAWVFSQSGKYGIEHPTDVRTFETARRWDAQDH